MSLARKKKRTKVVDIFGEVTTWHLGGCPWTFCLATAHGADNLYLADLKGRDAKPLTNYESGQIVAFRYSPDGKKIAVVHLTQQADVVLIRDDSAGAPNN